jgi:hypothetical protein
MPLDFVFLPRSRVSEKPTANKEETRVQQPFGVVAQSEEPTGLARGSSSLPWR